MASSLLGFNALILTAIAFIAGMINVSLLISLLHSYWKTYQEVKSEFTIGLLFFATFLLMQNTFSAIFLALPLLVPLEFTGTELGGPRIPLLLINIIQLVALSILVKITRK
jgi:hypothetical protein